MISFQFSIAAKGSCGDGVQLSGGQADVKLDGRTFRNKPIDGVTIALWINVTSVNGVHYLFDTIGGLRSVFLSIMFLNGT